MTTGDNPMVVTNVTCHATVFYPSGVMVIWQKDGHDQHEDVEYGETLPNNNGTFQKSTHLTVTSEEWKNNKYQCVVQVTGIKGGLHQGATRGLEVFRGHSFTITCSTQGGSFLLRAYPDSNTTQTQPAVNHSAAFLFPRCRLLPPRELQLLSTDSFLLSVTANSTTYLYIKTTKRPKRVEGVNLEMVSLKSRAEARLGEERAAQGTE
ncbi:hypothetical protein J4Q44_G00060770 [Coregonus suidteri]|uniref:Ig-like domain-containing protein n=1 Tax=Coregonus suidteri TaxID=861788 RepID=A0AAN8MCG6_9TELE